MSKRIDVKDLNVYYGKFLAVEGVNINIDAKSVTAFIGPSGCGKSTFLRTLNRMHEVIPGRPGGGRSPAGRRQPLRPRRGPGDRAQPDRHGLPAPQPVPHHVHPGQRAGRREAEQQADLQGATPMSWWRGRCRAPTSGTRSRTGWTSPAPASPAASSSACALPAPSRSSPR